MVMDSYIRLGILAYWFMFVSSNRCSTKLSNGIIKVHCCDNRIEMNGTCVECNVGYISDLGEPCHVCPAGSYGLKCADLCHCNTQQRCHHIRGCVDVTSTSRLTVIELTSESTDTSITTEDSKFESTDTPITTEDSKFETVNFEVTIYVICTVTIIVGLLMYKLHGRRNRQQSINHNEPRCTPRILRSQHQVEIQSMYNTIDESQMIEMPSHNSVTECQHITCTERPCVKSLNRTTCSDDGYLIPVPAFPEFDNHSYCSEKASCRKINSFKLNNMGNTDSSSFPKIQGKSKEHMADSEKHLVSKMHSFYTRTSQSDNSYLEMKVANLIPVNENYIKRSASSKRSASDGMFDTYFPFKETEQFETAKQLLNVRKKSHSDNSLESQKYLNYFAPFLSYQQTKRNSDKT